MKQRADKGRSEREFSVGEWVYMKLQLYRQTLVAVKQALKFSAKYYGPCLWCAIITYYGRKKKNRDPQL